MLLNEHSQISDFSKSTILITRDFSIYFAVFASSSCVLFWPFIYKFWTTNLTSESVTSPSPHEVNGCSKITLSHRREIRPLHQVWVTVYWSLTFPPARPYELITVLIIHSFIISEIFWFGMLIQTRKLCLLLRWTLSH